MIYYADAHFPQKLWDAGANGLTLPILEWDPDSRIMLYYGDDYLIYEMEEITDAVKKLFAGWEETLIYLCLQQVMDKIYKWSNIEMVILYPCL